MGVSRSEFIRLAVKHEVARLEKELKLKAMAKSFTAMRKNKHYIVDSNDLDIGLHDNKTEDADDWWL